MGCGTFGLDTTTVAHEVNFVVSAVWQPGDTNRDGALNSLDIDAIYQHLTEKPPTYVGTWPRTILAKLVTRLASGGATVIAFDGVFPEPDRTSPQNMLPIWAEGASNELLRAQLEMIPDHDTVFAEAIAKQTPGRCCATKPAPGRQENQPSAACTSTAPPCSNSVAPSTS